MNLRHCRGYVVAATAAMTEAPRARKAAQARWAKWRAEHPEKAAAKAEAKPGAPLRRQ